MSYIRTRNGKFALAAVVLATMAVATSTFAGPRSTETSCQTNCNTNYRVGYRACRNSADVAGCRATVYSIWLACYNNPINTNPATTVCVP